jgi:proteic killer suppression protein
MDCSFENDDLEKLETDPAFSGGYSVAVVKAFRKRMQQIRAAVDERTFYALKSLRFEKLKGKRSHQHSMRLNDQYRLILEIEHSGRANKIKIINIGDYH